MSETSRRGWFGWLFGAGGKSPSRSVESVGMAVLANLNRQRGKNREVKFEREYHSPNGEWLLIVGSIYDFNAVCSSSDDADGVAVLFNNRTLSCEISKIRQPNDVVLCNSGTFAINDWGIAEEFLGPDTHLRVFSCRGETLCCLRPGAAINTPALSADGVLLVFDTLAAPQDSQSPQDGGSLFLVETRSGSILWRRELPVNTLTSFEIDTSASLVLAKGQSGKVYRFTLEGEFLDSELVEAESLERDLADSYGYSLFDKAMALVPGHPEDSSPTNRSECAHLLEICIAKKMSPYTKANVHRKIGELAEFGGDLNRAIASFEAAIKCNPKVGLKRHLTALCKRLGNQS